MSSSSLQTQQHIPASHCSWHTAGAQLIFVEFVCTCIHNWMKKLAKKIWQLVSPVTEIRLWNWMWLQWWSLPDDTTWDKFMNSILLEARQPTEFWASTLCNRSSPWPLKGVPVPTRASQLHPSWIKSTGNNSKGLFCIWAPVWLIQLQLKRLQLSALLLLSVKLSFMRGRKTPFSWILVNSKPSSDAHKCTQNCHVPSSCSTVASMEKSTSSTPLWIAYSKDEMDTTNTQSSINTWKCSHLVWLHLIWVFWDIRSKVTFELTAQWWIIRKKLRSS